MSRFSRFQQIKSLKKSNIIFVGIIIFAISQIILPIFYPNSIFNPYNSGFAIIMDLIIYLGFFILAIYFRLEEKALSTKEVSLIIIYSAFTAVARIPFVSLPSVQPCSYLIFSAGFVFGPLIGFIIGANTALISNFMLGQGPWTLYQIIGWGLIGIIGGLLNYTKEKRPNKWINVIIGFSLGFIYGWLLNLWFWLIFIRPLTFESWILSNISSFYFDLSHAISNGVFLYLFGKKTINILYRYRHRFLVRIIEDSPHDAI